MKRKKKIIIWVVILAILALAGYGIFSNKKSVTTYTTEPVVRGNLMQTVSATGNMVSSQQADLSFVLTGKADSVLVDVGDKVKKGQKLASIDRSTFPQQLQQAQLDIAVQRKTLDNMRLNKNDDVFSKDQRDAQRATIEKAQAAYDAVLRQTRDNFLYAPVSGTIIRRNIDAGNVVKAGETVFAIADPDNLYIESNIPEADIVGVFAGQKALVTFDALTDDQIFSATVTSVDPASTVIQDVVFYRVKISMDDPDPRLRIGMSCNDDIVKSRTENILMIPQRAVKKEEGRKYVEVLKAGDDKQQTTEKVYVETGISGDDGMVEVKNNLKEGEKVVTFTKSS